MEHKTTARVLGLAVVGLSTSLWPRQTRPTLQVPRRQFSLQGATRLTDNDICGTAVGALISPSLVLVRELSSLWVVADRFAGSIHRRGVGKRGKQGPVSGPMRQRTMTHAHENRCVTKSPGA